MADISQQQQEVLEPPQTNGVLDGLTEEEKSKMRPADIDADMREMERRKRVEMMMNSRLFREELERIIETQMKDGSGPSGLLQQISEMMGPQGARFNTNVFRNSNCVVPINDIRGVESMGYAKGEKLLRCKLAAVFRLLDLYGWTQGVGGMITARLNQDQEHFLVNPYGLLYHEVTASSLVKVDMQGGIVEQGTTNFGVHIAGYQLHSTIHAARPDIKCIVHIATPSVTAISSTKCGLLPLGQESIVIGEVSNHHYINSSNVDPEEREKLARNFGPINKVMLLTNRGALCCGETVEEAFYNVYNTVLACETQLKLMPVGIDNLSLLSDEAQKVIYESSRKAPVPQHSSIIEPSPLVEKLEKRWRIGGTEFEALMRMLDNAGFRTGYIYRHPLVKSEPPRPRNDVEVPPAVSSLGYLLEEEELYKQGLWKGGRKGTDRTRWLNSPNVYQKVEILETGTPDPKKITKWVSDGSPTHSSTPVKIDGALQFVPKNTNPKEFKQLQQQIKDYRRADKISAGPQSHILEGVTWEEAKKMQDATISGTGEQVVLVGAASKGIIQRGFQHNATVYKTPYAKNPFDAVTDQELDQYKREIERKNKGDPYDESQSESEALSSFNISRVTHESSTAKSPIQSPVSVTSETEEESRDEPKVLRIETKQVPTPSQPEVVLSDVNADFLNEQRRSEMMLRQRTNGRGVSGVSRFSSSRSSSCSEDLESWPGSYEACRLETTRAQEFARPMKCSISEIQKPSMKSRMMKRDFFKNYESRLKYKDYQVIENESKLFVINTMSKFESARAKFDINLFNENSVIESENKKSGIKQQLPNELTAIVSNIKFSRNADMNFAEKVNLLIDYKVIENNIYDMNHKYEEENLSKPIIIEMNIKKNKKDHKQFNNTVTDVESLLDSTLKVFSDNDVENEKIEELKTNVEMKSIEYIENIKLNKDANIYVNEVEFCICDDYNEVESDDIEVNDEKYNTDSETGENENNENFINKSLQNKNNAYDTNNRNDEEIINYVNEVKFSIKQKTIGDLCEELKKCELLDKIDSDNGFNIDNNFDKQQQLDSQIQKKISNFNHSTNTDTVDSNSPDASLNIFLKTETESYLLDQPHIDSEVKNKNSGESDDFITKSHKKKSDENGNVWLSVNKSDVCPFNNDTEKLPKVIPSSLELTYSDIDKCCEEFSPASTTRESFFSDDDLVMKRITRRDSIAEVVSSINADIKPSNKVIVDMLADTENSIKYNLDSQNMSLIYSITPTNDIGDSSKNTTIEDILEDNENDFISYENRNNNDEIIQISSNNIEKKEIINMNRTIELSETSFVSNVSNQGSDLLELPSHTYLDLQKSSDEIFQKNMSTSVNQIINELNDAELLVSAENFVDEIIYDVACLNLPRDISKFSRIELRNFIQEKISALKFVKKIAKDLVGNLECYDANKSTNSKVSNKSEESVWVESLDQSVYVIRELIHHIIDNHNLGKCDFKCKKTITDKKVKESINIELKNLKDDYDATDEKNIKCSTPKILLSPSSSKHNSCSEDQVIFDVFNDNNNPPVIEKTVTCDLKCQQMSKMPVSSDSSPSTESQNFAEQEVTSESTDNDTKSDNSKEKKTHILGEILKKQSTFSISQTNSELTDNSSITGACDENNQLIQLKITPNKIIFCEIECANESNQHVQSNSDDQTSGTSGSPRDKTYYQKNEPEQLNITSNKMSYCVIECIKENENTQILNNEQTKDVDTESNESIQDFMQKYMTREGEIDQLWQVNEDKLEEIYAAERLNEIINVAEDIYCQENVQPMCKTADIEVPSILSNVEEKTTSFICNDNYCDDAVNTHLQFETVIGCGRDYILDKTCEFIENSKEQSLSLIMNEPESESVNNSDSSNSILESVDSNNRLPPILEMPELNSSCEGYIENTNDSKTTEFYSCQNSISFKSSDDQDINSTFTISIDPGCDCDKTYSADISATDEASSNSSTTVDCRSEIAMWEEMKAINCCGDITENFADVSNLADGSQDNMYDVTLEYMTSSFDTKEFLKIEMACKSNSEFSDNE